MTLEERAEKLIDDIYEESFKSAMEGKPGATVDVIKLALKEQDKITRHACAEAVILLETKYTTEGDEDYASVNEAHRVIMNCRGGVE